MSDDCTRCGQLGPGTRCQRCQAAGQDAVETLPDDTQVSDLLARSTPDPDTGTVRADGGEQTTLEGHHD